MTYVRPTLVSIGMPVFNCETTLASAVASILNQDYQDWELILIDDGSGDRTLEIARSFTDPRIRAIAGAGNLQTPARLNQAVELSNGTFFTRMDGDDIAYPQRLSRQVAYLTAHPDVDLLGTSVIVFQGDGEATEMRRMGGTHEWICRHPGSGISMPGPTCMGKTRWFRSNPYDIQAIRCEDQDLLLRTYRHSRFACIEDVLYGYREDSLSLRKRVLGRWNYTRALIRELSVEGRWRELAQAIAIKSSKVFIDSLAITTGLQYMILMHRDSRMPLDVLTSWKDVWRNVSERVVLP
jgi:glycosyltransferase involved in cell wall biosynthesis